MTVDDEHDYNEEVPTVLAFLQKGRSIELLSSHARRTFASAAQKLYADVGRQLWKLSTPSLHRLGYVESQAPSYFNASKMTYSQCYVRDGIYLDHNWSRLP